MLLNRNGAPPAYLSEAGGAAYLGDPAGAYAPGGASAPTIDPAGAYSGKRATAPTLAAAGAYIPGAAATSSVAEIGDPAGTYGGAGASALTIDPAGEGTPSYSLQFNQSTPVTLTEFALNPDANGDTEVTVTKPIASNGVTALLQVGNHYELEAVSTGTGPLLTLNGSPVTTGEFPAGWTPVGAVQTATGYEVAFGNPSGEFEVWNVDGNGNYVRAAALAVSATSIELAGLEANFGDGKFAGAGVAPANPSLIADNTVTTLNSVGNLFELTSDTSGTGPLLELNGSVVTSGQFTAKWTPVGALWTGDGYEVAFSSSLGYVVWNTDSNGDYTSAATPTPLAGTSPELAGVEANFREDFPGAQLPAPTTTIATNGVTTLAQVGNLYELYPASGGTGPLLELNGGVVTAGQFPTGWTPVGAVQTGNGYEVAWSVPGANEYVVWNTDGNGDYTSAATEILTGTSSELEGVEANFREDFPGAQLPAPTTTIATNGVTTLAQVGNLYELNPAAGGTGPLLEFHGGAVTAGQFGAGWAPVGAVQTDTGYQVAWSLLGQDTYVVWNTDSNGDYTSAYTAGQVSGQNFTLEDLNPVFGENLNGAPSLSAFLVTAPTGPGDAVNLGGQNQNATIDLGANSAFASNGLNAANPTFSGTPYAITLGPQADIIEYALAPGSGIETVATFNLSQDELNIAMGGAPNSVLQFDDVTVNSAPAVSIFNNADPAHGLVLLNPGENAAALQAHTTFIGGHALIS